MTHQKQTIFFSLIVILPIALSLIFVPRALTDSYLLPNVSLKMEEPQFWIKKIENPGRLLLAPEEIQKMNEQNLKKEDLLLHRVKDLKEEFTREEILSLLKDDWESFGYTGEVRYGRNGHSLEETFWTKLKNNLNQESLKERNRILFGLISKRTDIRVFPTEELSMSDSANYEFDRFQHSSISPGSPIAIYHFIKDRLWVYVQTPFIRGWVRITDLAVAKERSEIVDYDEAKDRLIITGNFIHVFGSPSLQQTVFLAQMGTSFPILDLPESSGMTGPYYVIRIPFREIDGKLTFRNAYVPGDEDVHRGFLPYTQKILPIRRLKCFISPMVGVKCLGLGTAHAL